MAPELQLAKGPKWTKK